jgi:DNA-binding MarR family transcriptional regulator
VSTTDGDDPADPADHLVPLLKHALGGLTAVITTALAPHGIDGRELAVLQTFAGDTPLSQQQAATDLQVDRTTMVALVDALEAKDLVERRPHPDDRRKNVVELTPAGRTTLRRADAAARKAEHRFLSPLSDRAVDQLRASLKALATPPDENLAGDVEKSSPASTSG